MGSSLFRYKLHVQFYLFRPLSRQRHTSLQLRPRLLGRAVQNSIRNWYIENKEHHTAIIWKINMTPLCHLYVIWIQRVCMVPCKRLSCLRFLHRREFLSGQSLLQLVRWAVSQLDVRHSLVEQYAQAPLYVSPFYTAVISRYSYRLAKDYSYQ